MAVDFYHLNDRLLKDRIFKLNDEDFITLEKVLVDFNRLTGVYIDPYGTTKIYPDHIKLIISLIEKYLNQLNSKKDYDLKMKLTKLLIDFHRVEDGVIVVGD